MSLQRTIQKYMDDWKEISKLDFCLIQKDNSIYISTSNISLPSSSELDNFRETEDSDTLLSEYHLYKTDLSHDAPDILIVNDASDTSSTIGALAVCQIRSLFEAYAEKNDKNSFMQKLLLGNYTEVEALNHARTLHISASAKRAVFMVQTRQTQDEHALATIKNIFSARTHDFITSMDNQTIVIIRELTAHDTYDDLNDVAHMLVDMLGAEAMTQAWVAYSNTADSLKDLANAYKESRIALEIGKTFYAEKNVFGYRTLGIGRLIYQLPVPVCEMFIEEIFQNESIEDVDSETLAIIRTFFENNLNLSETARQLYVHRNTLVYRFEKIQKKFGLDLRTFEDAMTFKLAMLVVRYLKSVQK